MPVKIKFTDRSRIIKRKLNEGRKRALDKSGPIGVAEMQALVPVDTFSLSDSIRVLFKFDRGELEWKAGGTNPQASQLNDPVEYAGAVEFGRADLAAYRAQPYFVPGIREAIPKIRNTTAQAYKDIFN